MPSSVATAREASLARAAARGDEVALRSLVAEHGELSWRLAAAVTGPAAATTAVAVGFARALVDLRSRRSLDAGVRPPLLAGTFAAALAIGAPADAPRTDAPRTDAAPADAGPADAATTAGLLAAAALRGLPERWRAAVWLHEVEGVEPGTIALALDTSPAVALQLTVRGRRVVLDRLEAAGLAPGDDLGALLAEAVALPPADLADAVVARGQAVAAVTSPPGWLAARAPRPLAATAAGVVAIGVIGIGVLGSQAGAGAGIDVRATSAPGTSATTGLIEPVAALFTPLRLLGLPAFSTAPAAPTGAPGGGGDGAPTPGTVTTDQPQVPGTGPSTTPPSGGAPSGGTPTTAPPARPTAPTTIVALGPVAATSGGGTIALDAPPLAHLGLGTCTSFSAAGATITVSCPAGAGSTSVPPTVAPTPAPVTVAPAPTAPATTTPATTTPVTTPPVAAVPVVASPVPVVASPVVASPVSAAPATAPVAQLLTPAPPTTAPAVPLPAPAPGAAPFRGLLGQLAAAIGALLR